MSFNLLGRGDAVAGPDRRRLDRLFRRPRRAAGCSAARSGPKTIRRTPRRCWSSATRTGGARSAAILPIVGRTFEMNDRMHTVVGVLPPMPQFPADNDVYMPPSACPVPVEPADDREPQRADADRDRPAAARRDAPARRRASSTRSRAGWSPPYPAGTTPPRTGFRTVGALRARRADAPRAPDAARAARHHRLRAAAGRCQRREPDARARASGASASSPSARRSAPAAAHRAAAADREHAARVAGGGLGLLVAWLVRDLLVAFTVALHAARRGNRDRRDCARIRARGLGRSPACCPVCCLRSHRRLRSPRDVTVRPRRRPQRGLGRAMRSSPRRSPISFVLLAGAGLLVRSCNQAAASRRRLPRRPRADDADRSGFREVRHAEPPPRFFRAGAGERAGRARRRRRPRSASRAARRSHSTMRTRLLVEGRPSADAACKPADLKFASPAYFETIGMSRLSGAPVHRGRRRQTTPPVAVVNLADGAALLF